MRVNTHTETLRNIIYEMMLCSMPNGEDIKMSQDVKAIVKGKVQIIQIQTVNSPKLISLGVEALRLLDQNKVRQIQSPKRKRIEELLSEGGDVKEIAEKAGVSESYVRQIKATGGM